MAAWTKFEQLVLLIAVAAGAAASAQPLEKAPPTAARAAPSAARAQKLATGVVIEVDAAAQRVLVEHGPIPSLGMDAMTMEFLVPDRRLVASLRPGDRIRFAADWKGGEYRITRIEDVTRSGKSRRGRPAN
jgi:Cu/Ag efflux protein CusF